MIESVDPRNFKNIIKWALASVSVFSSIFGLVCYRFYGNYYDFDTFENSNIVIKMAKTIFCLSLVSFYPLAVFPANQIIEGTLCKCFRQNDFARKWLKNSSRTIVCLLAITLSQFQINSIFKMGICIFLTIISPLLIHFKICATNYKTKIIDLLIIGFCLGLIGICGYEKIN